VAYRRPQNPVRVRPSKFRDFDGIAGPEYQVLKRFNERGWDISNTVSNGVTDLNLNQIGSMFKRDGCRKLDASGMSATVTNIFPMSIGNVPGFGIVVNGALEFVNLPTRNVAESPFDFSPQRSAAYYTVRNVRSNFTVEELQTKTVRELLYGNPARSSTRPPEDPSIAYP